MQKKQIDLEKTIKKLQDNGIDCCVLDGRENIPALICYDKGTLPKNSKEDDFIIYKD